MSLIERALQRVRGSGQPASTGALPARVAGLGKPVRARGIARRISGATPRLAVLLDRAALRAEGLLPPGAKEQQFARQYRRVKLPLLAAAFGETSPPVENGRLIMVASAVPGEGKTFTALNLALSLARERDTEVLLVDADVARPRLSAVLGLAGVPGLMDALTDEDCDVQPYVAPTDVPRFSVLPAGTAHEEDATELVGSARMKEVLGQLVESHPGRIVVFDSSPLLVTTESHVLAQLAGQIVLVVRADVTPRASVLAAIAALGEDKAVGVVLNQVPREPSAYYGYSDYHAAEGAATARAVRPPTPGTDTNAAAAPPHAYPSGPSDPMQEQPSP